MIFRNVAPGKLFVVIFCTLAASCANTSLLDSWQSDVPAKPFSHPLIIGVSDSQQTRQLYEKYFVKALKDIDISATPSYKLIDSRQKINRETVVEAIKSTDIPIDSVLVSYLVSADSNMKQRESPMNPGYSGLTDSNEISSTIVTNRGQSVSEEVYVLKTDLYDVSSRALVWSARTETVGPESVDEVIIEVTHLLIDEMQADDFIAK
jgi:hypothetical protein